jgi:hypothetical protein
MRRVKSKPNYRNVILSLPDVDYSPMLDVPYHATTALFFEQW